MAPTSVPPYGWSERAGMSIDEPVEPPAFLFSFVPCNSRAPSDLGLDHYLYIYFIRLFVSFILLFSIFLCVLMSINALGHLTFKQRVCNYLVYLPIPHWCVRTAGDRMNTVIYVLWYT